MRRKRDGAKRLRRFAVDHQTQIYRVIGKADEIPCVEYRLEFPREISRVLRADSERDKRPGVPQNGMPNLWFELMEILMSEDEPDAIFAQLCGHVGNAQGREGLELVDVNVK